MTITLYELAGAEEARRFSPYCWKTRMALAHKGFEAERIAWRFTEKDSIAFSGQGRVPVLRDDDRHVADSWQIARYLEETYPDRPALFRGDEGVSRFVNHWADSVVLPALARLIVSDVFDHLHEKDKTYFRETREARFGMPLEAVTANRDRDVVGFRQALQPLRATLADQPFLAGAQPAYADYCVFGAFMWARSVSAFPLLEADDPVAAWRGRLLDTFDGLARRAPGYDG